MTVIVEILPPVSDVVVAMDVVAVVVCWPAVFRLIRNCDVAQTIGVDEPSMSAIVRINASNVI